jgi:predicted DNA-binding transcriptional regulator YafY
MSRKKETLTLSVPPGTKEQLEAIAQRLGIFWGKSPSISGLLVAIAECKYELSEPFTFNSTQVATLEQSIRLLQDNGYMGHAQTLLTLLLERGNLEAPLRQEIMRKVNQPSIAWRIQAENLINENKPFHLLYRNAQEQDLAYTVRYAEISPEEKRFYLEIWCEETEDIKNPDYPELIHNRCLRFDRIKSIVPIDGYWRKEGLNTLQVYLHFYGGMVKAYESKPKDIRNEVIGEVRQVVRAISNPFWLIREIFRYGKDCEIVSPDNVRQHFQRELKAMRDRYQID